MTDINWSGFPATPYQTAYCRCGHVYRTHAKAVRQGDDIRMVAQTPCPGCSQTDDFRRIASDPESWSIA